MLFTLGVASNTALSCYFFFFVIIGLYFPIPTVVEQIFKFILGLVIPIGIASKEAKAEIEIHPVIAEANIRKSTEYNLELNKLFCGSNSPIHFPLFF